LKKAAVFAVPAVLVIVGLAFLVNFNLAVQSAARSNGWNQARGTIESVAEKAPELLKVTVRYDVAGHEYRSDRVTLGTLRKEDVPPRLQRYQVGRTVLIYVNPQNPAEAVLELGHFPAKTPMWTGWVLIYLGAAIGFVLWWRMTHKRKKRYRRRPGQTSTISQPRPPAPRPPTLTKPRRPTSRPPSLTKTKRP
jgi:hypothetical protein